ncbi:MAG: hypothetical protein ACRCV9_19020 [Burkholderiaceae bacterium]
MSLASDRLARYIAAETLILSSQEARMDLGNGSYRMLKMADLAEVRAEIETLQRKVAAENAATAGTPRIGGLGFALVNLSGDR